MSRQSSRLQSEREKRAVALHIGRLKKSSLKSQALDNEFFLNKVGKKKKKPQTPPRIVPIRPTAQDEKKKFKKSDFIQIEAAADDDDGREEPPESDDEQSLLETSDDFIANQGVEQSSPTFYVQAYDTSPIHDPYAGMDEKIVDLESS